MKDRCFFVLKHWSHKVTSFRNTMCSKFFLSLPFLTLSLRASSGIQRMDVCQNILQWQTSLAHHTQDRRDISQFQVFEIRRLKLHKVRWGSEIMKCSVASQDFKRWRHKVLKPLLWRSRYLKRDNWNDIWLQYSFFLPRNRIRRKGVWSRNVLVVATKRSFAIHTNICIFSSFSCVLGSRCSRKAWE